MAVELIFRKHIAVGQKSKDQTGAYGQGFNYQVEAAFAGHADEISVKKHLSQVLKAVDHRLLGLDSAIIGDPTTANICAWIFSELRVRGCAIRGLKLLRGDGLVAEINCKD